jgi:hypothetical protein
MNRARKGGFPLAAHSAGDARRLSERYTRDVVPAAVSSTTPKRASTSKTLKTRGSCSARADRPTRILAMDFTVRNLVDEAGGNPLSRILGLNSARFSRKEVDLGAE